MLWAASFGLATAGLACMAVGIMALFAWELDGMDPGTQSSAKVWGVPMALGLGLLIPLVCVFAWVYSAWCVRMVRTLFADPEPITLDRGWPSETT